MASFTQIQFITLFAYHAHTHQRLLECAARLSLDDYTQIPGDGLRSIHDLFFHLLRTDHSWRLGVESGARQPPLRPEDHPTLQSLQAAFEHEATAWQALLERLTAEQIEGDISLANRDGSAFAVPRWRILQHVVLHGMQHHAELAALLTAKGQSPGDIDFIFFR